MTHYRATLRRLALSTILLAWPLEGALAQDAQAVGDSLKTLAAAQGGAIAWTGISGDATKMTLEGVTISQAGNPETLPVGTVTLEDIEADNGGFKIGSLTLPAYDVSEAGMEFKMSGAVLSGLKLPGPGATGPLDTMMMYEGADVESVAVVVGGKEVFTLSNFSVEITPPKDGKPMEFGGSADEFSADLTVIDDPEAKAVIDELGYQSITGSLEVAGSWQPTDGRVKLDQYDITLEKLGTLGLTLDLAGYTPAFIKSLQEMQAAMAAQTGGDSSTQGLAMLGLLQQLTFHGASIRFDDDTLTSRTLQLFAKQQGSNPKTVASQAKAVVPFLLAQLNNPELMASASAAINKYLDDPKSIEITAAPANPVPFALLMAGAMSSPQDLPKTLGVKITANE